MFLLLLIWKSFCWLDSFANCPGQWTIDYILFIVARTRDNKISLIQTAAIIANLHLAPTGLLSVPRPFRRLISCWFYGCERKVIFGVIMIRINTSLLVSKPNKRVCSQAPDQQVQTCRIFLKVTSISGNISPYNAIIITHLQWRKPHRVSNN